MQLFNKNFKNILLATRAKDWRFSFIPQIFGNLYLWLLLFKIDFGIKGLILLLLSLITSFGFAALGYLINEYFDQEDDAKAGKINKLKFIPKLYLIKLIVIILLATFTPWIILPFDEISGVLVTTQIALFFLYASPPFRFKKNSYLSGITDALYAYIIPLLLSYYTYYLYSGSASINFHYIICYSILLYIAGYRNIIIHYINDIFKDKKAGLITMPRAIGVNNTNNLLISLLFIEFVLLIITVVIISKEIFLLWFLFLPILFLVYKAISQAQKLPDKIIVNKPIRHAPDLYYQVYAPAIILAVLIWYDFKWALLVPIHIALFIPLYRLHPFISWFKRINFKLYYIWTKQIISWVVNYTLFFMFILFGVNLKKRQLSALGYIKYKLNLK
jgi:1,4-dihydroxy-2-naphthoate octaprenyltransferase